MKKIFSICLLLLFLLSGNLIAQEPVANVQLKDAPNDHAEAIIITWEKSSSTDVESYLIERKLDISYQELVNELANGKKSYLSRIIALLQYASYDFTIEQRRSFRNFSPNRLGVEAFVEQYEEFWKEDKDLTIAVLQNNILVDMLNKYYDNWTPIAEVDVSTEEYENSDELIEARLPFIYRVSAKSPTGTSNPVASDKSLIAKDDWFHTEKLVVLIPVIVFIALLIMFVGRAKRGDKLYVRPLTGIQEVDNAIGRATEMGRPVLFVPGMTGLADVATIAALTILGRVAQKAAEYDTPIFVPCRDYIVLPVAQEIVKGAYLAAGRPDAYSNDTVFFISTAQFAYVAGVCGVMAREKTATHFYMGMFFAESLIMTERGNAGGAIQIAGTDADTQLPFFITTCDYTLIGEELYAASAYLAREPLLLGTLKAQDAGKAIITLTLIIGTILTTLAIVYPKVNLLNKFRDMFPSR